MLEVNFEGVGDVDLSFEKLQTWLVNVCNNESKILGDLSLIFCSDDYLLEINQQHLNHDFYTDIVTFDYCVEDVISGDLFISVDRVMENAVSFNVSFLHEMHRVIVHGVFHLCGFKDKSSVEEVVMRSKENQALLLLGFT
jgi:probable rRNA maturation factor